MRKMIFILCIPTALLSACSPSGMQGNPAAVQAGALTEYLVLFAKKGGT